MTMLAKILYRPVGIVGGLIGGALAGALFKRVWKLAAHDPDPPKPTDRNRRWLEIVLAAAVQGAVFRAVKAGIDRAGAVGFERATGVWPGKAQSSGR
jgi:hypothetical protein